MNRPQLAFALSFPQFIDAIFSKTDNDAKTRLVYITTLLASQYHQQTSHFGLKIIIIFP